MNSQTIDTTNGPSDPDDSERAPNWVNVFFLSGTFLVGLVAALLYFLLVGFHWEMMILVIGAVAVTNLSITGGLSSLLGPSNLRMPPPG